jgi:NAD(P)H dehydrogenase (quinone)
MNTAVTADSSGLRSAIIKQFLSQIPKEQLVGLARRPQKTKDLDVEIRCGDYNKESEFIKSLKTKVQSKNDINNT